MRDIEFPLVSKVLCAGAEEAGKALECHVLECAGRAMPQLKNVRVLVKRGDGADVGVIEVVALCLGRDALKLLM